MEIASRRKVLTNAFAAALAAVDPETLTREAIAGSVDPESTLIALGKAAAGMCRGAAAHLENPRGVCVTPTNDVVPQGVDVVVGDHPIPGERSLEAGRRVLEAARFARGPIVALISGGGSALCEHPIEGVSSQFIRETSEVLITSGASISEINLVRRHLSAIKGGGLAKAASNPIATYAISDVGDSDPSVIASGPTVHLPADVDAALGVMTRHGIYVPSAIRRAMTDAADGPGTSGSVEVIADGHTLAEALASEIRATGAEAAVIPGWLKGPVEVSLTNLLSKSGQGVTIATGEAELAVSGGGRGGRNTHAALLAAAALAGTAGVFAAFATDGVDGNSSSAGAIVDGATLRRGGDPSRALEHFDSGGYLASTDDLLGFGPTGTNVSDLWVVWK